MAHNETRNGLNENERLPRTWSRSTVADGRWMQNNTLSKYRNSDWFLASAIDGLLDKDDELTKAITDEATARQQNDGDLSAWSTRLTNSAEDLYTGLANEVAARQAADETEQQARTQGDDNTLASAKEYANDASAHALTEANTYTDAASSYLDGRFNTYVSNMNTWKSGIDTWKTGINKWRDETVDPALTNLQSQIDAFENATDVADVVPTSGSLNGYNKRLTPGAVIKVLSAGPGNDQQFYYRNKLEKTSAGPFHIENFDVLGSVQPYYSKSETYSKSELYDKAEMDALLLKKLDTSANKVWALSTIQNPNYGQDQFVNTLNDYQIMAHIDSDFNVISETYAKKTDLASYATKTYVNGTFASANSVYAKNQTSGKDQLNTAFENKLNASAAFEGHIKYNHQGGTPDVYDLGDLWYEYGFSSPPEETKVNNDQDDVIIYGYPENDRTYSARRYIGCFKRRKEIQLHNKVLEAWQLSTELPDFEHYPNTYFII